MRVARMAALLAAVLMVGTVRAADGPWERLLSSVGLDRSTLRINAVDLATVGGDSDRLAWFTVLHSDPLGIPFVARHFRSAALQAAPSVGKLVMQGAGRIGAGVRRDLIGDPIAAESRRAALPGALADAVAALEAPDGARLTPSRRSALNGAAGRVPPDAARAAALVLLVSARAARLRDRALASIPVADRARIFRALVSANPDSDSESDPLTTAPVRGVDLPLLMSAAADLGLAVDRACAILRETPSSARFSFAWGTPLGRVEMHGAGDDSYAPGPYLLAIDTAGNDLYRGGGATLDAYHGISVLIDVAGNDRYVQTPDFDRLDVAAAPSRKRSDLPPAFGAGVMGIGILADLDGDDRYASLNRSQGSGLLGAGILWDRAGNDRYDVYTTSQGSGTAGIGLLADLAGSDRYQCFTTSQAFGGVRGCGMLVDAGAGDDSYEANDTVLDFPSPQSAQHNASLSQGAGFGRRADYIDGHSLAGGIGVLVDEAGANRYVCGIFGQGVGYWYGAGILCGGTGPDVYRGAWYVQGASAHYAVGALIEAGGDDRYIATMNMAQGAGHDFGPGILDDASGSDRYEAPNLSLGGGNANGFGLFQDHGGDDTYVASVGTTTLGRASADPAVKGSLRERNLTLGLFLDTGGRDRYPDGMKWAHDGGSWTMADSGAGPFPSVRGGGLDTEAPGESTP